jgi:hypothetical protein
MAYGSFSLSQVQRQFDLQVVKGVFFADVPTLTPGAWLTDLLAKSAPFAAAQGKGREQSPKSPRVKIPSTSYGKATPTEGIYLHKQNGRVFP